MSVKEELGVFERALRAKCRTWTECAAELGARPGLRIVPFSGDVLREAALTGSIREWLAQLFEQLPPDVVVMDMVWNTATLVGQYPSSSSLYDRYYFVAASKEWPVIEEGSVIPDFIPTFKSEWLCKNGCGYEHNTLDRKQCEVCKRGRGD